MQPDQPANVSPKNVLCVEDEHFIGELYERALTKAGYKVTLIADGEEALKAAQTNIYDIILLDLMIPNLTGIDILKDLRDPARVPPINIEKQADGYLVKAELTPRELVNFVNTIK
jgi:DNA-binding response OmpR family regulator